MPGPISSTRPPGPGSAASTICDSTSRPGVLGQAWRAPRPAARRVARTSAGSIAGLPGSPAAATAAHRGRAGALAGLESAGAGGADHRRVVRTQTGSGNHEWDAQRRRTGGRPLPQHAVRRHAPAQHDGAGSGSGPRGSSSPPARRRPSPGMPTPARRSSVGSEPPGLGRHPGRPGASPSLPPGRRLEAAEAEVERVAQPGAGQRGRGASRPPPRAGRRSTRIPEPQEPTDLVECLACRVIDRLADQPIGQVVPHLVRETCGHRTTSAISGNSGSVRSALTRVDEPRGVQVALEVVHGDQRPVREPRERPGDVIPTNREPARPGPW